MSPMWHSMPFHMKLQLVVTTETGSCNPIKLPHDSTGQPLIQSVYPYNQRDLYDGEDMAASSCQDLSRRQRTSPCKPTKKLFTLPITHTALTYGEHYASEYHITGSTAFGDQEGQFLLARVHTSIKCGRQVPGTYGHVSLSHLLF
jgi:hypothetical protein